MNRTSRGMLAALVGAIAAAFFAGPSAAAAEALPARSIWFGSETLGPSDVVAGDLDVIFADVTCNGGTIRGDVHVYWGSFDAPNCTISGEVTDVSGNSVVSLIPWIPSSVSSHYLVYENRRLFTSLAYNAIVLVIFLLFPVRVRVALDRVERNPGLSGAVGLLTAIAVVPVAALLALSIIGIPLIVVELAALFAGIWIGQGAVALLIGRRLFEMSRPNASPAPLVALIVGLAVLSAVEAIPVAGWILIPIVWLVGLGATILGIVSETSFQRSIPVQPISGPPMKQ